MHEFIRPLMHSAKHALHGVGVLSNSLDKLIKILRVSFTLLSSVKRIVFYIVDRIIIELGAACEFLMSGLGLQVFKHKCLLC